MIHYETLMDHLTHIIQSRHRLGWVFMRMNVFHEELAHLGLTIHKDVRRNQSVRPCLTTICVTYVKL